MHHDVFDERTRPLAQPRIETERMRSARTTPPTALHNPEADGGGRRHAAFRKQRKVLPQVFLHQLLRPLLFKGLQRTDAPAVRCRVGQLHTQKSRRLVQRPVPLSTVAGGILHAQTAAEVRHTVPLCQHGQVRISVSPVRYPFKRTQNPLLTCDQKRFNAFLRSPQRSRHVYAPVRPHPQIDVPDRLALQFIGQPFSAIRQTQNHLIPPHAGYR